MDQLPLILGVGSLIAGTALWLWRGHLGWLVVTSLVSVGCAIFGWWTEPQKVFAADVPVRAQEGGYVGSEACRKCHESQHETWHQSYHRTMTQYVDPTTVLGRFDGKPLKGWGKTYRYLREDGEFFIEMPDPDFSGDPAKAPVVREKIVMSTGSHNQQSYWWATGDKRQLALTPFIWITAKQLWLPYDAVFIQPPTSEVGISQSPEQSSKALWNAICSGCHTTHPRVRYGDTDMTEPGIACEACHGPGRSHVSEMRNPVQRYTRHQDAATFGPMDPRSLKKERAAEVCGQCHSINTASPKREKEVQANGNGFRPGKNLSHATIMMDFASMPPHMRNSRRQINPYFWSDGGVRVSGRDMSAMIRSPCYLQGEMRCTSCHAMHPEGVDDKGLEDWRNHQLKPGMRGDRACTQCHEKTEFAAQKHTQHRPDSEGSRCMNCHMPYTTWGLLRGIRSHEVTSPNVAVEAQTGRPLACNQCHLDKSIRWTNRHLSEKWAIQSVPLPSDPTLDVASSVRWLLSGDAGVRALAAWSMSWPPAIAASGQDWQAPFLLQKLLDPYVAVRVVASWSLDTVHGFNGAFGPPTAVFKQRLGALRQGMARWRAYVKDNPPKLSADDDVPIAPPTWELADVVSRLLEQTDNRDVQLLE